MKKKKYTALSEKQKADIRYVSVLYPQLVKAVENGAKLLTDEYREGDVAFDKQHREEICSRITKEYGKLGSLKSRLRDGYKTQNSKWVTRDTDEYKTCVKSLNHQFINGDISLYELFMYRVEYGELELFRMGNAKLSLYTMVINFESAVHCTSKAKGDCCLGNQCYAYIGEIDYDDTYIYNELYSIYWETRPTEEIIKDILSVVQGKKARFVREIRFSCNGDFPSTEMVRKASAVADGLKAFGINCYTYTHRKGIDISNTPNLTINGSDEKTDGDNHYIAKNITDIPLNVEYACPCSIRKGVKCGTECNLCHESRGIMIYESINATAQTNIDKKLDKRAERWNPKVLKDNQ
jgi:hypothetical protein